MAGRIEVRLAHTAERLVVRHMMELYQHDFSEFDIPAAGKSRSYKKIRRRSSSGKVLKSTWPGQEHAVMADDEQWRGPVFTVTTRIESLGAQ
jgi:hypothetical protein